MSLGEEFTELRTSFRRNPYGVRSERPTKTNIYDVMKKQKVRRRKTKQQSSRKVVRTEKLRRIEVQNSEQRHHLGHKGSGGVLEMKWCSLCQYREETGGACSGGAKRR